MECLPLGLGPDYPILELPDLQGRHPAELNYFEYASLCRKFERLCTDSLLKQQEKSGSWVVTNDISEGPQLEKLQKAGYRTMTLVHVDVAQFVNTLYLKDRIPTHFLTAGWRVLREIGVTALIPDLIHLIFEKQEAAYRFSDAIVVPTSKMKAIILQCYPDLDPAKIHVVPWGDPSALFYDQPLSPTEMDQWRHSQKIAPNDFLVLTLSRISPEKGIDRLLRGLIELEKIQGAEASRIHVRIAGDAAYMDGPRTKKLLLNLIEKLQWIDVQWLGYLTGKEKTVAFRACDLYAFCSYHESYGLTLAEAQSQGCTCLVSQEVAANGVKGDEIYPVDASDPKAVASLLKNLLSRKKRSTQTPQTPFKIASDRLLEIMTLN